MKKEDGFSLIAYALMILTAVLVGLLVISNQLTPIPGTGLKVAVAVVSIIVALILNATIYEGVHAVAAIIGGYNVVKFNVLFFNFYRKPNDKWAFNFRSFDGLTGETTIAPKKENASPKGYLWSGTFIYAVQLIIALIVIITLTEKAQSNDTIAILLAGLTIHITLGGMLLLYNIFPTKLDSKNDGYFIRMLNGPTNIHAYNLVLETEDLVRKGLPVPEREPFAEITEFTAQFNYMLALDKEVVAKYDEAENILDLIIEDKNKQVPNRFKLNIEVEKIFVLLLQDKIEEAKVVYETITIEDRRYLSRTSTLDGLRRYFLVSAILDESLNEALVTYRKIRQKLAKENELQNSKDHLLFLRVLALVQSANPDFDFEQKPEN